MSSTWFSKSSTDSPVTAKPFSFLNRADGRFSNLDGLGGQKNYVIYHLHHDINLWKQKGSNLCVKKLVFFSTHHEFWGAPLGPLRKLEGPKTSDAPGTSVLETPMISEAEQTPRLGVARNKVREKGKKIENNNIFLNKKKEKQENLLSNRLYCRLEIMMGCFQGFVSSSFTAS